MRTATKHYLVPTLLASPRLRLGALAIAALATTACSNYTEAPLCTDANAVSVPGATGTFSLSSQDPKTFAVETDTVKIDASAKGQLRLASNSGSETSRTCEVGGVYISESYDKKAQAFNQSRLIVSDAGLSFAPLFYDKPSLERDGINTEVIAIPSSLQYGAAAKLFAPAVEALNWFAAEANLQDAKGQGLLIKSAGHRPEDIVAHAATGPVSLNLIRQ